MDWRLVLAVLCLIGTCARVDALSNQTNANTTSTPSTTANTSTTNTTSAQSTTTNSSTTNTTSAQSTTTNSSTTNTTLAPRTTNSSTTNTTIAPRTTTNSSTTNTTSAPRTTNSSTTNTTIAPRTTTNSSTTNTTSAPRTTNSSTTNTTSAESTTTNSSTSANLPLRTTRTSSLTSTPVVAAAFNLVFSISETFDPVLANTSSPQFVAKATSIRNELEPVYRAAYTNFLQMIIVGFRNGSIVINSRLEFSDNGTIPNNSTVQNTLGNVTNNNTSLKIDLNSISVIQAPVTSTISEGPTTNTTSTSSTTTTNIPPAPQNATAIFSLIFSISETFDPALANTSSTQFVAKATSIRNQVEPLYKKAFKNFILMQILKFTSGSTVTESNLYMDSSGPNATLSQVRDTFLSGLKTLNFSVDPNSVSINMNPGNAMPPVIDSSLSMIWMSLLSLLLSVALHF